MLSKLLVISATALAVSSVLQGQTPPKFTVTDLGGLPGFAQSQATAISSNGTIVGYSSTQAFQFYGPGANGSAQAWIYLNGKMTALPSTQNATVPLGVNAAGQVVGMMGPAAPGDTQNPPGNTLFSPFLFQNGGYAQPAGFPQFGAPVAINDAGQVAFMINPGENTQTPGVWKAGVLTPLSIGNNPLGTVFGISQNGLAAGAIISSLAGNHPILAEVWNNGQPSAFTLPSGVTQANAYSVNNSGQATGFLYVGSKSIHAAVFQNGGSTDLGSFNGYSYNTGFSINDSGWVVGFGTSTAPNGVLTDNFISILQGSYLLSPGNANAFLAINGTLYDLFSLVTNNTGWEFDYAYAINDANQIVGTGFHNGVATAFLLNPPLAGGPSISQIVNAEGNGPTIAANTWVAIKGANLAPAGDSRVWQSADFVNNQMPTSLDGVRVMMNGENAYVYYISGNQINVLTPPDLAAGPVQVVVTVGTLQSSVATVQSQAESPSFFVFNGGPYVIAVHLNGTLVGPTSLYPGLSTPAAPGETIVIFANGFGPTSQALVPGSNNQSGALPALPNVTIGGTAAKVSFAGLISPGLFQFNVTVPAGAPSGDNSISATYNGFSTQAGTLLSVQQAGSQMRTLTPSTRP